VLAQIAQSKVTADKHRLRGANLVWATCTIKGTIRNKQRKCVRVVVPEGGSAVFGSGPYYAIPEGY